MARDAGGRFAAAPSFQELYADMPSPFMNPAALSAEAERTLLALHGGNSLRPDLAGTTFGQLRAPSTYQQKVATMWQAYATDPLFMRLINRVVDFVAAGARWEHQGDPDNAEGRRETWPKKIKRRQTNRKETEIDREEDIWQAWSKAINRDMPNTPQGLDFVVRWAARHCLLGGMFVPHWEWDQFRFGKQQFLMPMSLTCYPPSAIALRRPMGLFIKEDIYVHLPSVGTPMSEIMGVEANPMGGSGPGMIQLSAMGSQPPTVGWTEAFALKYEWSPGDLTTTRVGNFTQTGWGQYPMPPFQALLPHFALRQKLFASDNALADGVAQYVKVFKIGNEKYPVKMQRRDSSGAIVEKGTIEQVREILEPMLSSSALAMYLPWFVDMDYKMPNTETLMNEEKYIPSSIEILQAFGFLFPRSSAGRNEDLNWVNIAGFEELLKTVQKHISAFMVRFVRGIVAANPRSLKHEPTWTPFPPNTKSAEFRKQLAELASLGRLSSQTLLEHHDLNIDTEQRRIAKDLANEADQMYDDNVPMNNKQQVVTPGGGKATPKALPKGKNPAVPALPADPAAVEISNTNPRKTPPKGTVPKAARRKR